MEIASLCWSRIGASLLIRQDYWNLFVMAMTANGQSRVDLCVEQLCRDGCGKVTEYINRLQAGDSLPELAHLSPVEIRAVLDELVSVMAAYEGSCKS